MRLAVALAFAAVGVLPARAARNSPPAQVTMIATMPATFTLQAAPATVSGAAGSVQSQYAGNGRLLIRGQVRAWGGRAVVRIPISLAANTRNFVVQAVAQHGASPASIYMGGPGIMARRVPMHGGASLAMATAKDHGREFFSLNHPLQSTLEVVFENLPPGQTRTFRLLLGMRDLGY